MEFTIKFTWEPDGTIMLPKVDGWDGLDQARAISTETATVDMALVDPIPADREIAQGATFNLTEAQARATASFQRDNARKVITTEARLKKLFDLEGIVEKDAGGAITRVGWRYVFDGDEFIQKWTNAGEPQEWK